MSMQRAGYGRRHRTYQPDDTNTPLFDGAISSPNRAAMCLFHSSLPMWACGGERMTSLWQIKAKDDNGDIEVHFAVGPSLDDMGPDEKEMVAMSMAQSFAQGTGLIPVEINATMGEALEQIVGVDE